MDNNLINILLVIIKIAFLLGFLILIHECGHFFVAKLCKIKVNEFAIGFGPTIWKKQGKETKYALRLIPLGGFVSMVGEEQREDVEGSFSSASIPKRIAIVAAGGLVNIIFAITIYFILVSTKGGYISNIVDEVSNNPENSIEKIMQNDEILEVNGKKIHLKSDLAEALKKSNGNEVEVIVKRNEQNKLLKIKPLEEKHKATGIYLNASNNKEQTKVVSVEQNSVAKNAGIEAGDIITEVNGIKVEGNREELIKAINSDESSLSLKIKRHEEENEITIIPSEESTYYLGVTLKKSEENFFSNLKYAVYDTGNFLFSIIENLKMLFTGKVSMDQFMGPVGIGTVVSQTSGISDFIYILALVSLSLGVTNLLPIPALDGGKILLLIIEAIRRKPLSEKVEINIQMIGFLILITLSLYVTYNDVLRIF